MNLASPQGTRQGGGIALSQPFEKMDRKLSLEQILAFIPQERLNQKVSDVHVAEISRGLINWRSVCTNLGINEVEEEEIQEDYEHANKRRYL